MFSLIGMFMFSSFLGASYLYKESGKEKGKDSTAQPKQEAKNKSGDQMPITSVIAEPLQNGLSQQELEVNHYLKVSGVGLGLAVAGNLFFPPLALLSIPAIAYSSLMVFEDSFKNLKKKTVSFSVLDSSLIFAGVATGSYSLGCAANIFYLGSQKALCITRDITNKIYIDILKAYNPVVWLLKDGVEVSIPLEKLRNGDLIVVNAGEIIPIDGFIVDGIAGIYQQMLTGEVRPEEKTTGQPVFAATMVVSGRITIRVEKAS